MLAALLYSGHKTHMIFLPRPLYQQLIHHLSTVYPQEGCGFVAGSHGRATHIYPIPNQLHSPTHYQMAPQAQISTLYAIEAAHKQLLAIYHSHPNSPPVPSATDIAQAAYPQAMHLIVSLQNKTNPIIRGYRIIGQHVKNTAVVVE